MFDRTFAIVKLNRLTNENINYINCDWLLHTPNEWEVYMDFTRTDRDGGRQLSQNLQTISAGNY